MSNRRTTWKNKPDLTTPIDADNLNNLEANAFKGAEFADVPTTIGLMLLTATSEAIARGAIGAGSSNLVISTTAPANLAASSYVGASTTVARSDHVHALPASATTTANGLMSSADKTKLDGIAAGATNLKIGTTATDAKAGNWTPPNASYNTYGLVKIGNETPQTAAMNVVTLTDGRTYAVQFDQQGHAVVNVPWVSTTYTLPEATTSAIGGLKKALGVEDSDATELVTLRNSFNELLANLRDAGIMQ